MENGMGYRMEPTQWFYLAILGIYMEVIPNP